MDKQAFYAKAREIQKIADELVEMVLAMEERPPSPPVEAPPPVLANTNMMSIKQLAEYFNVGKSTIQDWIKAGKFPEGERLFNSRLRRWRLADVEAAYAAIQRGEGPGAQKKEGRRQKTRGLAAPAGA